jgi:pimeloyl-ACP methyl ester carboxylesterase
MSAGAPRVLTYTLSGSPEFVLAYGPENGPQLVVLQPFFEEMNRCRALVSALCRGLALKGFGCWLPDLPGTGESTRALDDVCWSDWLSAITAVDELVRARTGRMPATVAIRGGALLEAAAERRRWRLSPTSGRSLMSDLRRSALMSGGDPSAPAGYRLSTDLTEGLQQADSIAYPGTRTLRLASDDRPADRHVEGSPLWRRPEPVSDAPLAQCLIDDIATWTTS